MRRKLFWLLWILLIPGFVYAKVSPMQVEPVSTVIFWVTVIFLFGIIGRYIAELVHQPGVLGELIMGVLLGNVGYYFGMPLAILIREGAATLNVMSDLLNNGDLQKAVAENIQNQHYVQQVYNVLSLPEGIKLMKVVYVVDVFARLGIIFLLFMVGLETSVAEIFKTGKDSLKVAILGVFSPIALGYIFMYFVMPQESFYTDLFVASTLCATSIGITAKVLKQTNNLKIIESKTILGAAILDDILGLIILATISSIIMHNTIDIYGIMNIFFMSILFFSATFYFGPNLIKKAVACFKFLNVWEAKLFISFVFVMLLSWLASLIHLSTIIGAFAAGIIIHDDLFAKLEGDYTKRKIHNLVGPLEFILAPLFFMLVGMQVKIELFFDFNVLVLSLGLIVVAILGKLVCSLGARKGKCPWLVGVGMLPRGEVGLVFVSIGQRLGVINDELYSAIILMILVTTIITPPWIKYLTKDVACN